MTTDESAERTHFILELGRALHVYGAPTHRLERALKKVCQKLSIESQILCIPTGILAWFKDNDKESTTLMRVEPGGIELERLCLVDEIGDDVLSGEISIKEGLSRIHRVRDAPSRFPNWSKSLAFGVSSSGIASFLGVQWIDLVTAFFVGMVVGLIMIAGREAQEYEQIKEVLAAFCAAILAGVCSIWFPVHFQAVVLSSLIVIVPGLAITVAMSELATRNLVAGTARLMGAVTTMMKLVFGVALGTKILVLLGFPPLSTVQSQIPEWVSLVSILFSAAAFTVLFQARPRDISWIIFAAVTGFFSAKLGTHVFGPELGVFLGGVAVGVSSNTFARLRHRPATILLVPGIILLVPGSIGYRSVSQILDYQIGLGLELAFSVLVIAISLVGGLFIGNTIIPPKRAL